MPLTVLLADDSPHAQRMIGQYLGELGCQTVTAAFAEAAWRALRIHRPDLLMLDVALPGLEGREFCRRLHAMPEWARTPVLLLAGALDEAEAEAPAGSAILRKPVTLSAVATALAEFFPDVTFPRRATTSAPAAPRIAMPARSLAPAAVPPARPSEIEPDPDASRLRQILARYLPDAQVATIVAEWERQRRLSLSR